MTNLPATISTSWIGLLLVFGIAALTLVNTWNSLRKKRDEEADEASDRLVKILQGTVKELETKVESHETKLLENAKQIASLTTANELMTKLLEGRDKETLEFQKQGFEAFKNISELAKIARSINEFVINNPSITLQIQKPQ